MCLKDVLDAVAFTIFHCRRDIDGMHIIHGQIQYHSVIFFDDRFVVCKTHFEIDSWAEQFEWRFTIYLKEPKQRRRRQRRWRRR